jgi:uncharacterized membrane protein YjfL (UPF0719 family)
MNNKLVLLALLELGMSILLGVMVLYVAYYMLINVVFKRAHIEKDNVAHAIVVSAILFAVGNIMEGAIDPIANAIRQITNIHTGAGRITFEACKYIFMFVGISAFLAVCINYIAIRLFTSLTQVNEMEEISANNVAVAIVTSAITIIISIFAKKPAIHLMEGIIPYPEIPVIL